MSLRVLPRASVYAHVVRVLPARRGAGVPRGVRAAGLLPPPAVCEAVLYVGQEGPGTAEEGRRQAGQGGQDC